MGKMESYYLNLPLNLNTRENSYRQQQQQLAVLHTVFRLRITFFPIFVRMDRCYSSSNEMRLVILQAGDDT